MHWNVIWFLLGGEMKIMYGSRKAESQVTGASPSFAELAGRPRFLPLGIHFLICEMRGWAGV